MKKDKFYLVLRHRGKLFTGLKIQLSDNQTIVTMPTLPLKNLHSTLHQPNDLHQSSVFHVRESFKERVVSLLRVGSGVNNPTFQDMGQTMIDLDIHEESLQVFKKKSFTDCDVLDTQEFGRYITFYIFQGTLEDITTKVDAMLRSKIATVVIPHSDGFRLHSPKYPVKYALYVFKGTRNITVGILALGHNSLNEEMKQALTSGNNKQCLIPIKYIAFASKGLRAIGEA